MKRTVSGILFGLMFLVGFGVLIYPTVSNQWNTYRQSKLITSYEEVVQEMEEEDFSEEWELARDFNETIEYNAIYGDAFGTEDTDYIYTGCAGAGYLESSLTNQNGMMNNEGNGYEFITEEFTLFNGASLISDYTDTYVLVTLADGSQIKVTQSQPDASGTISVNWNDNNNIVVAVNQTDVIFGQQTIVDFVQETVRVEDMMLGLVNSFIYRCFSNY